MNRWLILLALGMGLSSPVYAKRAPKKQSYEERMEIFQEVFAALDANDRNGAADHLMTIINNTDPTYAYYHVDAYVQLAGLLEEFSLPYSALIAYQKALELDAGRVPTAAQKAINLADQLGDTALLESIFSNNFALEVEGDTRSRMAYLAAREIFQKGELGPALGILQMVQSTDPDYPEAQNLLGIIYSQMGSHEAAIKPLQTAYKKGLEMKKGAKFQEAVLMNMARAYFSAKNYGQSSVYYEQIPRESMYWLDAQFERGWAHFHLKDMNGTLGILHTLQSPFFTNEYYAEAEMLRIYVLIGYMCKFTEANQEIDNFAIRFTPQQENFAILGAKSPSELFNMVRDEIEGKESELPYSLSRKFTQEDSILDALHSIKAAEDEANRLNGHGTQYAKMAQGWVLARKDAIIEKEGNRLKMRIIKMSMDLQRMLSSLDITRLDILDMETQMLNRAAQTGKMEEAKRQVRREKRIKNGELVWEYQGEYWADEVGYYRVNTKSECSIQMME